MTPATNGRTQRRRRWLAIVLGLGLLAGCELLLRGLGVGSPGHRRDPFAGFSVSEPLFVGGVDRSGEQILRTRDDRIGPFRPSQFRRTKPQGTIRIFCLGGSSTYGFPLDQEHAFCTLLGQALRASRPAFRFEMINCGGMSYGSRRVLNVFRELTGYSPDALVVYMGHNEYLERRFFAPFIGEPRWRRRLRVGLNELRLYVVLRRILDPLLRRGGDTDGDIFGVGPRRDDSLRLSRDPREDQLVKEQFSFTLDEMTALAAAHSIPLFIVKPASNLRGWPPEASDWKEDLSPEAEERRDTALARATQQHRDGADVLALAAVNEAFGIDPGAAEILYLRGAILDRLGRAAAAKEAYRRARDLDAVPIRITSSLETAIEEAWSRSGTPPADAQAALGRRSPQQIVGNESVLDYCHPSATGHRQIAELLHGWVQAALWPDSEVRPLDPATLGALDVEDGSAFGTAWQGQMLLRQGQVAESLPLFRRALEIDSRLATAHEGLGRALVMSGQLEAGILELEEATRLDQNAATGWNNLGRAYSEAGRLEEAVTAYNRSLATGTGTAVTRVNLSEVYMAMGRVEDAELQIDAALEDSPALARAWVARGEIAEGRGDTAAAAAAFRRALDLAPGLVRARDGLARGRAR